jgi:hypothetical protein
MCTLLEESLLLFPPFNYCCINFRKKVKNRKESSELLQEQTGEDKLSKDDSDDEILGSILK